MNELSDAATVDSMLALVATLGRARTATLERLDRGQGGNIVLAVELDGDAAAVIVKRFASPRTFAQARRALQWFDERSTCGGARLPRELAADPHSATLVMDRLPGAPPLLEHAAAHRAAGRFLAALHQLELPDRDPLPVAEALLRRHHSWMRACADRLDDRERRVAIELRPSPELFAASTRVPCHRDFTPDNWLWTTDTLAVVDFEHARLDLAIADFAKLAVGVWSRTPALATAFFEGYGRRPDHADYTRLRHAVVLHGLASFAWGVRHGSAAFIEEGRRALTLAERWPEPDWVSATDSLASPL